MKPIVASDLGVTRPDPNSGRVRPKEVWSVRVDLCDDCMSSVQLKLIEAYDLVCGLPKRTVVPQAPKEPTT